MVVIKIATAKQKTKRRPILAPDIAVQYRCIKTQKQNNLKKRITKIKMNKFLIVRINDNIKLIPDFSAHPTMRSSFPCACELDQLLSERIQIIKKQRRILNNYRVSFTKNAKIFIPKDLYRAPSFN